MSWSSPIHCRFSDEATARAMAAELGVEFPEDGTLPTGNHNFALAAPIVEWLTRPTLEAPGVARDGYWALLRLRTDWSGYGHTMAALEAAGVIRTLAEPCNVFAEGD